MECFISCILFLLEAGYPALFVTIQFLSHLLQMFFWFGSRFSEGPNRVGVLSYLAHLMMKTKQFFLKM
jgi:hypothetical protein